MTPAHCVLNILDFNWSQRFRDKKTKLNICHHMLMSSTTAKQVISRRRKNQNIFKMSEDEKCTCKACKNTVFHCQICKFVRFLLPSSSWMLKLPTSSNLAALDFFRAYPKLHRKVTSLQMLFSDRFRKFPN